jgi:tRNA-dihydrouridine synthase
MHIWQQIKQSNEPIFILAPMEDVTDTVFRRVVANAGRPSIFFTEFVNVDGLCSRGRKNVIHRLQFTPEEQPLIAQIWGEKPENFYTVAQELSQMGFTGVDINMGCPERGIVARGCCAGLINHPNKAQEIIQATKEGAGNLPVSVKTRCGVNKWMIEEWAEVLLSQDIAALTIHGRIAKEMSHFPARWEEIAKAVLIRDRIAPDTLIIGNGDVDSYQDGLNKIQQYGVDGVMVGRGIFHNLWLFNQDENLTTISVQTRLNTLIDHILLWQQTWEGQKNFDALKKFYKIYLRDFDNASDVRTTLMALHDADSTTNALKEIVEQLHTS